MKKILLVSLLISALLSGCAKNHFNVPTDNFADQVKTLGIAPIFVDADSDIRHPQKEQLISLLIDSNRRNEPQFVRKLKTAGNFFTIAFMDGEAQNTFGKLFSRSEKRDDATIQYNKYFWKTDELKKYIQRNNLDAVMLIVVSGLTKKDKVSSIVQMKSMTSDYNHLIMTAQILDANGTILWEYPNFRQRILAFEPMVNLEYPDFSEADANLSSVANVKFKTIDGIRRIFELKRKDLLLRETQEPDVYATQFDAMVSLLKYDPDKEKKGTQQPANEKQQPRPAVVQPAKGPELKPVAEPEPAPVQVERAPLKTIKTIETTTLDPADDVVPAEENSR